MLEKKNDSESSERIKIIVADDHPAVVEGISFLISSTDKIQIIGTASNGEEALTLISELQPDVLVSDISMPGTSGIELLQQVKKESPNTKVLILSMHKDIEYIMKSYEHGAMGYLPKYSDQKELVNAIESIHRGEKYIMPEVSIALAQSMISPVTKTDFSLTKREKEIIKMLVQGMSNKQIAADLFISIRTVDTHRTNIMKKLNVKNVASLVKLALKEDLFKS